MQSACFYTHCMATLQIRNVPESVHRTIKARAAASGRSLSDYLLGEVTRLANRPTLEELSTRIAERGRSRIDADIVKILHDERSGH